MFEIMTAIGDREYVAPPGEVYFNTPNTTQTWTVPAGIKTICGIALSGGASGGGVSGGGGGGGGMLYFNDYKVKEGDVFSIFIGPQATYQYGNGQSGADVTVSKNGTNIIGVSGGGGGLKGGFGTGGSPGTGTARSDLVATSARVYTAEGQWGVQGTSNKGGKGGSAARYDGQAMTQDAPQSPYGIQGADPFYGKAGAGGDGSNSSISGSRGCFRIMWGANRSFPRNATKV